MVKVISHKAASPLHAGGSIVFARWRQCAPMKRMLACAHPTLQPKRHVDRFIRFLHMGTGMGGSGNRGDAKNGNGNAVLQWEWVGIGMGMIRWEWEGNGNKKVIPAHL